MTAAVPVYAGIIVSDLQRASEWYAAHLQCHVQSVQEGWALLEFNDGSQIELVVGDPERPGVAFPSYGTDPGPPVMPGFSVEDPDLLAADLRVARRLPDWIVVVAPDGLRVVLTDRDGNRESGLVGFRFSSPEPDGQRQFLHQIGAAEPVDHGAAPAVVPVIVCGRDATVTDPDGTRIQLVRQTPVELHA